MRSQTDRNQIERLKANRKYRLALFVLTLLMGIGASMIPLITQAKCPAESPKILKSASELDYPPFAIVHADGTADGFSVDLLKAATEAVGLSVSFKVGPWNELKQELADRILDVLPLVSYSEERDKVYDHRPDNAGYNKRRSCPAYSPDKTRFTSHPLYWLQQFPL